MLTQVNVCPSSLRTNMLRPKQTPERKLQGHPTSPATSPHHDVSSSPEVPLRSLYADHQAAIAKRKATTEANGSPKRIKQSPSSPEADVKAEEDPSAPLAKRIVPFPEKPAVIEERNGEIEFRVVNNDGRRESTIILTGLKCIFQKQLPKMPKDYIARLVYDRTHLSIAIVKKPLEVVGWVSRIL